MYHCVVMQFGSGSNSTEKNGSNFRMHFACVALVADLLNPCSCLYCFYNMKFSIINTSPSMCWTNPAYYTVYMPTTNKIKRHKFLLIN